MQNSRSTLFSITAVLAVTVTLLFLGGGVDAEVSLEKMTQNCLLLENEVATLVDGSALAVMNKACKSVHHAWCAPTSDIGHHTKTGRS